MNKAYLYNFLKSVSIVFVCWLLNLLAFAPADKTIFSAMEHSASLILDVSTTELDSFLYEDKNEIEKLNSLISRRNYLTSLVNIFDIKSKISTNIDRQTRRVYFPGISSDLPPPSERA